VRDDHATVFPNGFVRTGLFRMPVRIDQRVDAAVACRIADGFQQSVRIGSKAAVNHECAVIAVQGYHIATGTLN
jgi:hypothetical protein